MTMATFKDLCIDAVDAEVLGRFWGDVLGLESETLDDGDVRLSGTTPQHTIWVNTVPEPVTVKQRVHLDVHAEAHEDVVALGATPVDLDSFRWQVLRDPEGGELCTFEPRGGAGVPEYRLKEVIVDAADPERIATWWADVFGVPATHQSDESWIADIPGAPFDALLFGAVPEPKRVKNRIHWDVTAPNVELLVGDGARVLRPADDDVTWTVLADPEGNEFCVFGS